MREKEAQPLREALSTKYEVRLALEVEADAKTASNTPTTTQWWEVERSYARYRTTHERAEKSIRQG